MKTLDEVYREFEAESVEFEKFKRRSAAENVLGFIVFVVHNWDRIVFVVTLLFILLFPDMFLVRSRGRFHMLAVHSDKPASISGENRIL